MQQGDAPPPSNVMAEAELLGSLLAFWSPDVFEKAKAVLKDGADFYDPRHKVVWRGISAVAATGAHVDTTTVGYFLSGHYDAAQRSFLDTAGGQPRLEVLAAMAASYGVVERALIVAKDGEWRRRLNSARNQVEACLRRDEVGFMAATGQGQRLRVIEGGERQAS